YALLEAGPVPVDYIKCPLSPNSRSEVEKARELRPVLLHGWGPAYRVADPEVPEPDLLRELIELSNTPYLSVPLDALGEETDPQSFIAKVQSGVAALQCLSGLDVLLENVPWWPGQNRPYAVADPKLISEAVRASGAWFLVDTAHAQVAAWHRNEPI